MILFRFSIKNTALLLFLGFCMFQSLHAQKLSVESAKVIGIYKEKRFSHKNNIQLEALGQGGLYSFNYELILLNGSLLKSALDAGIAFYPPVIDMPNFLTPITLNEIVSFGKHHAEIGLGCVLAFDVFNPAEGEADLREFNVLYTCRIGYRFQKPKGKYLLRVGFTPIFYLPFSADDKLPWGGISFGYCF